MSKVFVAGATGVLGRRAVARMVAAGHEVTAVARSAEKAEQLRASGATPVAVSLFDRDALAAAVAGHDVVVNLATSIPSLTSAMVPGAWRANDRIRTEGSANLVDAALAAGAARYVQESIVFPYPESGDAWIDAESAAPAAVSFVESVAAAEASAARFAAGGGTAVVLRFGLFYAADAVHTRAMVRAARWGAALVGGRRSAYQSMVHADDAADAVVAALDSAGGTYDVVDDDPLTKAETVRVMGGRVAVPGALAKLGGPYGGLMARSQRVSNRRFKEATGWAPRHPSLREGWPAVVAEVAAEPRPPLVARLVRPILFVLAAGALQLGAWATLAPRSFYDDFPTSARRWVAVDGPYNEHLIRDFGGLNLALATVLVAAFLRPERFLVRTAALASLLFAVPHLTYHATHLDPYTSTDKVLNVVLLGVAVVLPFVLVLGTTKATTGAVHGRSGAGRYGPAPSWAPSASSSPPSPASRPG